MDKHENNIASFPEVQGQHTSDSLDHARDELRSVRDDLQESQGLLQGVLNSSLDGIMAFQSIREADGTIVDFEWLLVNPEAGRMTGQEASELIGKRLLEVMPGNKGRGLFDAYVQVVETGKPYRSEFSYQADGMDAWFSNTAVKLGDGFMVTFRDITEQRDAEHQLKNMNRVLEQRNRELQDFAYIASHDLQEPLRKVRAFADLLREDYGEAVDEVGQHYLERMQDAARRMSQLINDLLSFSRISTQGKPFEPVDLNDVLNDVIADVEVHISDVEGTLIRGKLPTLDADERQMRQLLQNLISNAFKFSRKGVRPVVSVHASPAPEALMPGQEACVLAVSDNGIGFDEKYLDRIFTPFQRLHRREQYSGTGIGLAICRRIVERHGGSITATSTPGEGSTFFVTLPLQHSDPLQQSALPNLET